MKSVEHDPLNEMTIEKVDQLEHLKLIYMETMRRNPPGPMNTGASVNGTVTIDGIQLHPGDLFFIGVQWMHMDPTQWQSP